MTSAEHELSERWTVLGGPSKSATMVLILSGRLPCSLHSADQKLNHHALHFAPARGTLRPEPFNAHMTLSQGRWRARVGRIKRHLPVPQQLRNRLHSSTWECPRHQGDAPAEQQPQCFVCVGLG